MTGVFISGLILGAVGSVHCIGMCGPLAMALPSVSKNETSRFLSTLLYNVGRMLTYSIYGLLAGIIGMSFALFGFQQWLSIILGLLIIVYVLFSKKKYAQPGTVFMLLEKLRALLGNLFFKRNYHSVFFIGLLNGLLPCGMVYMALAGAVSTGSMLKSAFFMAAFGLGTLPVMWSIAFFGSSVSLNMRLSIKKLYPYLMFGMALLLIVRGLGLGIPYMSPLLNEHGLRPADMVGCHD